jgi:hypothetical protein
VGTGVPRSRKGETLLVVSDGGAVKDKGYGSFGWILWECKGIARGNPMHFDRAEGYGRISLLLFLNRYLLYLEIQPSKDLRITF